MPGEVDNFNTYCSAFIAAASTAKLMEICEQFLKL